ncbi:MAG: RidA family protein [Bifidobacteriaceae bacterium]|jgi:enamine deaminase RidA (YjgF/YER057c/UK114 family)|nr:RidA family protein [Bifidobacteriaceae bacterium]
MTQDSSPPSPELALAALGIELPRAAAPLAAYLPVRVSGRTAFVSGQGPTRDGRAVFLGLLGRDLTADQGHDAARLAAVNILAALRAALGGLDKVAQFDRLAVMVASTPDFTEHPRVANGASELIAAVFGEAGRHARVAYGVAALPLGWPVEVEAQVTLTESP